jgi:hypothetical protein
MPVHAAMFMKKSGLLAGAAFARLALKVLNSWGSG